MIHNDKSQITRRKKCLFSYLLELANFLRQFALILHVLDTGFMEYVELLLEELCLLGRDLTILL